MLHQVLIVTGILIIAFGPYLYFNKESKMNDKTYLALLTIGSLLIVGGLYMSPEKNGGTYFLIGVTIVLFILALIDAFKAISGKMTKYEKHRLEMYKQAQEAQKAEAARNKNFKM